MVGVRRRHREGSIAPIGKRWLVRLRLGSPPNARTYEVYRESAAEAERMRAYFARMVARGREAALAPYRYAPTRRPRRPKPAEVEAALPASLASLAPAVEPEPEVVQDLTWQQRLWLGKLADTLNAGIHESEISSRQTVEWELPMAKGVVQVLRQITEGSGLGLPG